MVSLFAKFVARTLEIPVTDPRLRKKAHQKEREAVVEKSIERPAVPIVEVESTVTPADGQTSEVNQSS